MYLLKKVNNYIFNESPCSPDLLKHFSILFYIWHIIIMNIASGKHIVINENIFYYLNTFYTATGLYIESKYIIYLISLFLLLYAFRIFTIFIFVLLNVFFFLYWVGPFHPSHNLSLLMCVTILLIFCQKNKQHTWAIRTLEIYYSLYFFGAGINKIVYSGISWPMLVPDHLLQIYLLEAYSYISNYIIHQVIYYTPYMPVIMGVLVLLIEVLCPWFIHSKKKLLHYTGLIGLFIFFLSLELTIGFKHGLLALPILLLFYLDKHDSKLYRNFIKWKDSTIDKLVSTRRNPQSL